MITVDWANAEETVAIWQFRKDWSAEQFYQASDFSSQVIFAKNQSVNIIFDFSYSRHAPQNIMSLLTILFKKCPPNVGTMVIYAQTSYWERLFTAVLSGLKIQNPVHFSSDLDEVYQYVGLHDD